MAIKGKKYLKLCDTKLQKEFNSIGETKKYLIDNSSCQNLDNQMLQAVSIYLFEPTLAIR